MFAEVTLPPYRTGASAASANPSQPASRGSRPPSPPRRGRWRCARSRSPRRARRRSTSPPPRSAAGVEVREAAARAGDRRSRPPGRPRGRRAARRRTGSGGARRRRARPSFRADQLVGLARVAPALGVPDDDPGRQADEHRRGDLAGVRARELVMDVLGADADVRRRLVGEGVAATAARQTNGGQMTRVTPGSRVRAAIVRASSPASAGVVCIFQLPATITSRIAANHARAGRAGTAGSASIVARRSSRSRARWTADRWISSRSASSARVASGVSRRASATRRTTSGCSASRPSASSVAIASSWRPAALDRPLEVGRLGVEHAVELAAERPRDLPRLELEQRPGRRRSGAGTCPTASPLFHVTTPRPRRSRHDAGSPTRPSRRRGSGASSGVDDELEVRPAAGEAQRAAGEEPAAQPGRPAVLGRRSPSRTADGRASVARRPAQPVGEPRDGRLASPPRVRAEAVASAIAVARPRRVDRGQLVAQRDDEVALGAAHRGQADARRRARGAASRLSRSMARRIAAARRAGSWWWALAGSTTSSRTRRGAGIDRRAASAAATASARPRRVGRRASSKPVVREHEVDELRAACGRRAPRRASARSKPVGLARLGRDVADVERGRLAPRRPRRGSPGSAGPAARSCTGCPGRGR